MQVFEYIMVMVSVILALALAQLLRALTEIVRNPKGYWVHTAWVFALCGSIVTVWWGYWDYHNIEAWTFVRYLYLFLMPLGLFMASYLLVPENSSTGTDWQKHFFATRKWFFLTLILLNIPGILGAWIILGVPLLHPIRAFQAFTLALMGIGIVAKSHSVHAKIVILFLAVGTAGVLLVRMNAGALTNTQ